MAERAAEPDAVGDTDPFPHQVQRLRAGAVYVQRAQWPGSAASASRIRARPGVRDLGLEDPGRGDGAIPESALAERIRELQRPDESGHAVAEHGALPRHGEQRQPESDARHAAQRKLRARVSATIYDRHVDPES